MPAPSPGRTPASPQPPSPPPAQPALGREALWALLFGNFVIGCAVMVVPGALNDIARSLQVPVAAAGQLITAGALVMCVGAPLLAALLGRWERHHLLVVALLWCAAGHALCALSPGFSTLLPVRALSLLAAAAFTPQAAAVVSYLADPLRRGQAITFIFIGWALASVAGLPAAAWVSETLGWRVAMGGVCVLALLAAAWVHRALPRELRPPPLSMKSWRAAVGHPALMAMVLVTALLGAGQFTLFSYFAPHITHRVDTSPTGLGALFLWFGVFGVIGNLWVSRHIDRLGAHRMVGITAVMMALSLLLWPLGLSWWTLALIATPWGLACFGSNSAQQARLGHAAPALAPALIALNTSAIYLGQATGAAGGGWLVAHGPPQDPYAWLSWVGLAWVLAGLALSLWVTRALRLRPAH